MSDRPYDAFGHRFFVPLQGVIIGGTASALATENLAGAMQVPFACKLVSGTRHNYVGATAAVAAVSAVIAKSVAGTGTLSAVGTYVWNGTAATGAVGSAATLVSGTGANFAANDLVTISEAIGTVAAISTHSFTLGFEELFN